MKLFITAIYLFVSTMAFIELEEIMCYTDDQQVSFVFMVVVVDICAVFGINGFPDENRQEDDNKFNL